MDISDARDLALFAFVEELPQSAPNMKWMSLLMMIEDGSDDETTVQ